MLKSPRGFDPSWGSPRNAPASGCCADVSPRCDYEAIASLSGGRAWRLIWCWPLLNRKICERGRSRAQKRLSRVARTAGNCDGPITLKCAGCFGRLPCPCSAPASLYEPRLFFALQRALPPFAFARSSVNLKPMWKQVAAAPLLFQLVPSAYYSIVPAAPLAPWANAPE